MIDAQVREYLEKHYEETAGDATAKLALKALTETVEASSKNIEVAVTTKDAGQHARCHLSEALMCLIVYTQEL